MSRALPAIAVVFIAVILGVEVAPAYSVLTHEEVVDLLWRDQIAPLLKKRFPRSSEEDLRTAHAYAYGGSMVQDMGYYPFGNKFFSNLLHYVRSGDFVETLIKDSDNLNEYAFALGALAHYASDNSGHPTINHVVAIEFPRLRKKYGEQVTYAEDPKAHIRTEFGFDMVQVAKKRYTNDRYHDFVGFEVSQSLLERAFRENYGLDLEDVIDNETLAIGTFRWAVSQAIPQMTRVALLSRRQEMVNEDPNFDQKKFLYYLSRTDYEKQWGADYRRPDFGTRVLAILLKLIPKFGSFRALNFKIPTPQTENLYIKSVDRTVEEYANLLREEDAHSLRLQNLDCDTGRETILGEYALSDATYAKLLDKLAERNFVRTPAELRRNILHYFESYSGSAASTFKGRKAKRRVEREIEKLRAAGEGRLRTARNDKQRGDAEILSTIRESR